MEIAERTKDNIIMHILSQKQIFDKLRVAVMNLIRCCFAINTKIAITKPAKKAIPIISDMFECIAEY